MARFNEIGTATIPGNGTRLRLLQRNDEFSIKIAGAPGELMNSRLHGSEDALATLPPTHQSNSARSLSTIPPTHCSRRCRHLR